MGYHRPKLHGLGVSKTHQERGAIAFWNIWRYPKADRIDSRIGNSGLYADETSPGVYVLHCSNGIGEVDFEDLVVEVRIFGPGSEQRSEFADQLG